MFHIILCSYRHAYGQIDMVLSKGLNCLSAFYLAIRLCHCSAVMSGRITAAARPSACPCGFLTRKRHRVKHIIGLDAPQGKNSQYSA